MLKDNLSQADKELLNKEKEAASGMRKVLPQESKKGKAPASKPPASSTGTQSQKVAKDSGTSAGTGNTSGGASSSSRPHQPNPPPTNFNAEVASILKELNENQHKLNDRLDTLATRVDSLSYGYETEDYDYYEQFNDADTVESEQQNETSSVVSECLEPPSSEPPNKKQKTDSVFKNINIKFNTKEKVDPDIDEELAKFIKSAFIDGITEDDQTLLTKDVNRPGNCPALVKTRVNQSIWRLLKSHTQTDDSKMQSIQNNIIKAAINFAKILDQCGDEIDGNLVEMGTNALALLGQSSKLINNKRKEFHRSDLDVRYHYLTSSSLPYTADKLYGDEVNKNIKEIQDINRVGKNIGRGQSGSSRGAFRGRRPFKFGQGRGRARGRGRGMDHNTNFSAGGSNFAGPKNGRTGAKK